MSLIDRIYSLSKNFLAGLVVAGLSAWVVDPHWFRPLVDAFLATFR